VGSGDDPPVASLSFVGVCLSVAVAGVTGALIYLAVRHKDRWLVAGGAEPAGEGAFRAGTVTRNPRLARRRFFVMAVAVLNVVCAGVTLFLLVPAGVLGTLLATNSPSPWFWVGIGLAALDGVPVSILLAVAAFLLAQRTPRATLLNAIAAIWSAVHHGAVASLGIAFALTGGREADMGWGSAVIAGVGLAHAMLVGLAAVLARPQPDDRSR
jgi:MFS family permease